MKYTSLLLSKIRQEPVQILPLIIGLGLLFIIALSLLLGFKTGRELSHFGEGGLVTWVSGTQLLVISWLSYYLYKIRKKTTTDKTKNFNIWLILSFGFFFLFTDEIFMIHESLDKNFHMFFNIMETPLSDRIDDVIIAIYALIGIGIFYTFKNEVFLFRPLILYFGAGFEFGLLSIVFDLSLNGGGIFQYLFHKEVEIYMTAAGIILEESIKLFAEYFFILGMLEAIKMAQDLDKEIE